MGVRILGFDQQEQGRFVGTLEVDGVARMARFIVTPMWSGMRLVAEDAGTRAAFRDRPWIPERAGRILSEILSGRTVNLPARLIEPA